jgi:hypothetical protein
VKKETPRGNGAAHRAGRATKSVARLANAPALDFLTLPLNDPADEARCLFPGAWASQRYLRSAYVEIAAAGASSTTAAAWLERARAIAGRELQDPDRRRATFVEDALVAAREQFRAAARSCRHSASLISEARRLTPRRRKLRIVS